MRYREWNRSYAENYTSSNPIVRYFFNMRLKNALSISREVEERPLVSLTALEIGCYDGRFSLQLCDLYRFVIGTELNPAHLFEYMIPSCGKKRPFFCAANALSLPFKESTFDVIYGLGVFEHFPHGNEPYKEICRVLRPRGKLIAGLPVELGVSLLAKKFVLDLIGRSRITFKDIIRSFSLQEENGPFWNQDHRDYNWKKTRNQIVKHGMRITTQRYLPFPQLKSLGNPFIIIVAEKESNKNP